MLRIVSRAAVLAGDIKQFNLGIGKVQGIIAKLVITLALSTFSFSSHAIVISHSTADVAFGPFAGSASISSFDQAHFAFASTTTSSLEITGITGSIDPNLHLLQTPGGLGYPVILDLWDGASWINIFTSSVFAVNTNLSAILGGTINFAPVTATAMRLVSTGDYSWNYHGVSRGMQYTLNSVSVPEPGALVIFVLGVAGLSFMRRRRTA